MSKSIKKSITKNSNKTYFFENNIGNIIIGALLFILLIYLFLDLTCGENPPKINQPNLQFVPFYVSRVD